MELEPTAGLLTVKSAAWAALGIMNAATEARAIPDISVVRRDFIHGTIPELNRFEYRVSTVL
jgi:hypothetical protein